MVFSRRPECEDSVDRFSHTWLVYFLLFMAALTFTIPFWLFQPAEVKRLEDLPRYNFACVCPDDFSNSEVEYVKTVCRDALVRVQSGHEVSKEENGVAVLYKKWRPDSREQKERYIPENNINSSTTGEFGEHQLKGTVNFLFDSTPVFLFLSAVCIKLAHLSFVLFISWYGVNVSGLIQSWKILYLQNTERGEQERQNFINIVSERFGSSRRLTSGYFIYKAVICFICTMFTLIVNMYFISSIQLAQSQLTPTSTSSTLKSLRITCEVNLLKLNGISSHSIQCMLTQALPSDEAVTDRTFSLYGSIFGGLFFTFTIINTINAVNMILWMVKLCRKRCFSTSKETLSLDASLLVRLMEEHLDPKALKAMEDSLVNKRPKPNADLTSEGTD